MGQAPTATQNQITQNDIYQIMDKIEGAKTDAEREAMHVELDKALLLWDTINQPIKSSSEKVNN
jgi:glutamate dehydrogenase/leucine dehydrogenase